MNIKDSIGFIDYKGERAVSITHMSYLLKAKNVAISDYVFFQSQSSLEEYEAYEKEFIELQSKLEPEMDTEDLQFLFNMIAKNNKEINRIFKEEVIPQLKQNNKKKAMEIEIKISMLSRSSFQFFEELRTLVNDERENAIANAYKTVEKTITTLIISIVIAIATGSISVVLISRRINRNLSQIVNMVNKVSKGDLTVEKINYIGKDEIGELSTAMNQMQYNLRGIVKEIITSSLEVSNQGNTLNQISKEVKEGSEQIVATMQEMSGSVEEQASSSNEIASLITRLIEIIKQANRSSTELENSSNDILTVACKGNEQMKISIDKMNEINIIFKGSVMRVKKLEKNSEDISKLVQVINAIAEQTNLLALNAAIEAARAGEAGRGFSVVAEEIKKLSEQVGKSVSEITNIVAGIQNESSLMTELLEKGYQQVEEGTDQIKITGQAFKAINDEVIEMVDKIKDTSENLNHIIEKSKPVNMESEHIAAISEENSAGIEETVALVEQQNSSMEIITQNANSLSSLAERLNKIISQFKL